jgi:hypothetical protein
VTDVLPGTILERVDYWKLDYDERTEIRLAFKAAYEYVTLLIYLSYLLIVVVRDCFSCGIVHTFGFLGTNLLWDDITKAM